MKSELLIHNLFKQSIDAFLKNDPHLNNLARLRYVFHPSLEREITMDIPGIYMLTGGRQVGKSTLMKLMIQNLLGDKKVPPEQICYVACDLFERYQELVTVMQQGFDEMDRKKYHYLFLDEITYVKDWDRAIKYFADLGYFKNGSLLITGSDSVILKESMKKFPGRRGRADTNDFHYYPISFYDYVCLVTADQKMEIDTVRELFRSLHAIADKPSDILADKMAGIDPRIISNYYDQYLLTGGFLSAINNFTEKERIDKFIYRTYQEWVIGNILKRNKDESFLKDIITVLSTRLATQLSGHAIAAQTEIQHHATVQDYLKILQDMDVLFIQPALREDKLSPAPKKAKKIHFSDPFIAQALIAWAKRIDDPWEFADKCIVHDNPPKAQIIEGCISTLIRRKYPTFYIKAESEVDNAVVFGRTFLPIEVKWSEHLRKNDLKQILKYKKGIIGYRGMQIGQYEHLLVLPIPVLALLV
ncbi:ATP-binding protein [candidate division WOR-3 bacterium]|nr:ATP-binding protein [candidate division WOR-3 bacterium]